jgi:phosphodiesterase/alkaline phosphatase D-like protein
MQKKSSTLLVVLGIIIVVGLGFLVLSKAPIDEDTQSAQSTGSPLISNVQVTNVTATSATVTWTTDTPSSTQVRYRKSGTNSWTNFPNPAVDNPTTGAGVTSHSVQLSGLTANTTYQYRPKSCFNPSQNSSCRVVGVSPALTFRTTGVVGNDTTPPSFVGNLSANTITTTSLILSWTAATDASGIRAYDIYQNGNYIGTATGTSTSYAVSGLTPATAYTFIVQPYDNATPANYATGNPSITVTTLSQTSDTIAPNTVTGLTATNITATAFTLSWQPAVDPTPSSGIRNYEVYGPNQGTCSTNGSAGYCGSVSGTSISISGLSTGTYSGSTGANAGFTVIAYDNAGNNSSPATRLTVTLSGGSTDTTAPTSSVATAGNVWTNTAVSRAISCADNVGGSGCRNSYWKFVASGTTCPTSGYTTGTNATYATEGQWRLCYFSDDNASPTNTEVPKYTEIFKIDTTAPTVTIASPTSGTVSGTTTITANAADTLSNIANVQFKIDGVNVGTADTTSPYTYSWNTTTATNGTHTITAVATDNAGNTTTSGTVTVTVNNTAPLAITSGPTSSGVTSSSASIVWGTNNASKSLIVYDTVSHAGLSTGTVASNTGADYPLTFPASRTYEPTMVTTHAMQLSSLSTSTTYYYRVLSNDGTTTVASAEASFTTTSSITALAWPAGTGTSFAQDSSYEPSGLYYEGITGTLYSVGDGGTIKKHNASTGAVQSSWSVGGNLEGITGTGIFSVVGAPYLYTIQEDATSTVREFNPSTGAFTAKSWTLSGAMPVNVSANTGAEGLAFVPNGYHPYTTSASGGVFYASTQLNGRIYVFDINLSTSGSITALGSFDNPAVSLCGNDISDLSFSPATGKLYVLCDTADIVVELNLAPSLSVPTLGNVYTLANVTQDGEEGFALMPSCTASTTTAYVAHDGGSGSTNNLFMRYSSYPQACVTSTVATSITNPPAGTVNGTLSVSANATTTSPAQIVGVQFKLDGANLGVEDTTAPYAVTWNTTTATNGTHTLTAIARDTTGRTITSSTVTVTVNNTTPLAITAGPTAGSITTTGAAIAWTTNNASNSQVKYGTVSGSYPNSQPATPDPTMLTSHNIQLIGLNPSTTYYYVVLSNDGSTSVQSSQGTFTTPANSSVTIAAVGDIAISSGYQSEVASRISSINAVTPLSAVLQLGDIAYNSGLLSEFNANYAPSWGVSWIRNLSHPVPGNHEYMDTSGGTSGALRAKGYFDYFNGVGVTTGIAGTRGQGWHNYNVGGWHLVGLNSNEKCTYISCSAGSTQEVWLRNDLQSDNSLCEIAYWHHPRWTSIGSSGHSPTTEMQALWQALVDNNVDILLVGHNHFYERFAKMNGSGAASSTGTRQFIIGTGGTDNFYASSGFNTIASNSEKRISTNNSYNGTSGSSVGAGYGHGGVLKLTLGATSYSWEFIGVNGTVLDSGSDTCH